MDDDAFTYAGGRVDPGETQNLRYTVSETYFGDPIRVPVTVVNGSEPGPKVFLSAAIHGDELNGVEVIREVAHEWDHADLRGTLICLPILNVPGFMAQQRYLPIYDRDLNRSFPGDDESTNAKRIAHRIFRNFVAPCDLGVDLHTSTRGRSNMLHVRADMDDDEVARVAKAFGSNVIISSTGPEGSLRREASEAGAATITIEMGEAHRFQRELIDRALGCIRSLLAEYGVKPAAEVTWPGWRTIIDGNGDKTWIRANTGGLVDMHHERGDLVHEDERICRITNPFNDDAETVRAPFTGLLVGVLENPLVYPGNPLCHFVRLDDRTRRAVEREQSTVRSNEGS